MVNVAEGPVIEAGAAQSAGVGGGLYRIEIQSRVQHAHGKGRRLRLLPEEPQAVGTGKPRSDGFARRPHLVGVASAADHGQRPTVALVQREIGTIRRQHRRARRQSEEILLPQTERVVIARAQIRRNTLLIKAPQTLEKTAVVTVGGTHTVEDIAGHHHEIDVAVDRGIHHAVPSLGNRLGQAAPPFLGKGAQPAEGRSDMDIGGMDECQRFGHQVLEPPDAGIIVVVGELSELGVEDQVDVGKRAVAVLGHDQLGHAHIGTVLAFGLHLARGTIDEHNDVGVLLDGARFAQVGQHGALIAALLDASG